MSHRTRSHHKRRLPATYPKGVPVPVLLQVAPGIATLRDALEFDVRYGPARRDPFMEPKRENIGTYLTPTSLRYRIARYQGDW